MNTEKLINKWEKVRQKGEKKFVLTAGIIMGAAILTGNVIGRMVLGNFSDLSMGYHVYVYLTCFIGGFAGGVIGAFIRWDLNEKKYNRLIDKNKVQKLQKL